MAQPARRPRARPSSTSPTKPPNPPENGAELVTCFVSGAQLAKADAVSVRLGPGKVMWMAKALTNQG